MIRLSGLLIALLIMACSPVVETDSAEGTLIYLMRHAEKAPPQPAAPHDPDLSAAGYARADRLAQLLQMEPITAIYSTGYIRTQKTVEPLAVMHGIEVQPYDPQDLPAFASQLKAMSGRIVVVGHSNTTPSMVELLGGDPGPPIDDATEFDRLYILHRYPAQPVVTTVLRYSGG